MNDWMLNGLDLKDFLKANAINGRRLEANDDSDIPDTVDWRT